MKKIEIDTFLKFQFVSNPSFSPDGKYIAFVVSNADRAENTYKANLYVYDMAEKKVRKMTSGAMSGQTTIPFSSRLQDAAR